jgi:hypothetical protein
MALETKPGNAAGYYPDVTVACERTLLTLLGAFGSLKTTLRLVGGLVPRYLTPVMPPDVPAHAGTSDVDMVLNLQVIAEGDGYAALANQLKARGFSCVHDYNYKQVPWRWTIAVEKHTSVVVEFLRDAGDKQPGKAVSVDGEEVSALTIRFAGIVHDWYQEREISGDLLNGKGISTETVRFADVPAFVILKVLALDDRKESKDAADLIHVLRYAGSIEEVAELFVRRIQSGAHADAVQSGLTALRRCFCDDKHGEGYRKHGSIAYAHFHDTGNGEELISNQRYAAGLVQSVLDGIEQRLG